MVTKILKSHTIVPDSLYVRREADRVLAEVIADMGRPGYILVARQMGKTNLLLHAKRTLQDLNDAFVYVDLTNSFTDARECFRHIIDVTIETHYEKFSYLKQLIEEDRVKSNLLDHAEHTTELRKLLRAIKGKLVIILDEIDALTNTGFSDTIFKQIRSVYFSRVNFPEMEGLTYVLSGVAEPSALIKDPAISPFNIGQSIFLGDFSYDEYIKFIEISQLKVSDEVIRRIYYWSNGNPRMTYDICSNVESLAVENECISNNDIDELVSSMYFTSIDRVPVDHIKELIKTDAELRSAVINIKEKDLSTVSSQVRKKLYLSGVVGSDFDSSDLRIKNKIIDNSLSLEWLESLNKSLVLDYKAVIALFKAERYSDIASITDDNISLILSYPSGAYAENAIVNSYLRLHAFNAVTTYFEKFGLGLNTLNENGVDYEKAKLGTIYLGALAYLSLGNFKKSIEYFEIVIAKERKDELYYRSLIDCSSSYIGLKQYAVALEKLKSTVDKLANDKHSFKSSIFQALRNIAYYSMARCEIVEGNLLSAKKSLDASLRSADVASRPALLYMLASIITDEMTRAEILEEAIYIIIDNQFKAQDFGIQNILNVSYECIEGIVELCSKYSLLALLNLIINYVAETDLRDEIKPIFLKNGNFIQNNFDEIEMRCQSKLYGVILDTKHDMITEKHCSILLQFAVDIDDKVASFRDVMPLVVALTKFDFIKSLDRVQAKVFANCLIYATNGKYIKDAKAIVLFLRRIYAESKVIHSYNNELLFNFCEMQLDYRDSKAASVYKKSRELLKGISYFDRVRSDANSFINLDSVDAIRASAFDNFVKLHFMYGGPNVNKKRSDLVTAIYEDGKVKLGLFRNFEADFELGKCILI
jgi:tetratricopeptide (TPR) repeat protein